MRQHSLLLVLLAVLAVCSAGSAGEQQPALPTVQEAIQKAIRLVDGRVVFEKPIVVAGRRVGRRVVVRFARPVSDVMVEPGRKAERALLTVTFRRGVRPTMRWAGRPVRPTPQRKAFARAAMAAHIYLCSPAYTEGRFEGPTALEAKVLHDGKGYSVGVERIPYIPGGHTVVVLTGDYRVARVLRGL